MSDILLVFGFTVKEDCRLFVGRCTILAIKVVISDHPRSPGVRSGIYIWDMRGTRSRSTKVILLYMYIYIYIMYRSEKNKRRYSSGSTNTNKIDPIENED